MCCWLNQIEAKKIFKEERRKKRSKRVSVAQNSTCVFVLCPEVCDNQLSEWMNERSELRKLFARLQTDEYFWNAIICQQHFAAADAETQNLPWEQCHKMAILLFQYLALISKKIAQSD